MESRAEIEFYEAARACARQQAHRLGLAYDCREDCAQSFVVRLLSLRGDPPLWNWPRARRFAYLRRAARNHALNFLRHEHATVDIYGGPPASDHGRWQLAEDAAHSPERILLQRLFWQEIQQALDRLTPLQQTLVVGYHVRHERAPELAGELGCTHHAVHSLLSYARHRLGACLAARGSTEADLRSYL